MMRLSRGRKVTLVKNFGQEDESRQDIVGDVQPKMGFFGPTAPVMAGDVIEEPDPRLAGAVLRRTIADVSIYHGHHIEVTWGQPPAPIQGKPKVLTIGSLHPRIGAAAASLYEGGHMGQAAFEALKAVEVRVREMSGVSEVGQKLIGRVFGGSKPLFRLTGRSDTFADDEHEGRRLVFMGAMLAIRNPAAHEITSGSDEPVTVEDRRREPAAAEARRDPALGAADG